VRAAYSFRALRERVCPVRADEAERTIEASDILVATGRAPNTAGKY
jgi:pyruvate/2-oxoglutarate dehydrogenase complex dihydrolipoamide dehydrogenase (E3) component